MTAPTLSVDTATIRTAADLVNQAAAEFAADGAGLQANSPLAGGSLGSSAIADAVVTAAGHQLTRAQEATLGLAERTRTVAGAMQTAAILFDTVDAAIGALQ